MVVRILAIIILGYSILSLPFWVSVALAIGAMFYFTFFIEAVIIFFISDLLYAVPQDRYYDVTIVSTLFCLLCFIILEIVKKKIRFDPK